MVEVIYFFIMLFKQSLFDHFQFSQGIFCAYELVFVTMSTLAWVSFGCVCAYNIHTKLVNSIVNAPVTYFDTYFHFFLTFFFIFSR